MEIKELVLGWRKLCFDLKKTKKVDFGFFKEIFSGTYELLSQQGQGDCVTRDCTALVAEAYLFANADISLDGKYFAALVLTERMLSCCAFKAVAEVPAGAYVYVFEARKEVYVSFKDVDESIIEMEKLVVRDNFDI